MASIDMAENRGAAVPLSRASSFPDVAWVEIYIRTKWRLHTFSRLATIDMNRKLEHVLLLGFQGSCDPI